MTRPQLWHTKYVYVFISKCIKTDKILPKYSNQNSLFTSMDRWTEVDFYLAHMFTSAFLLVFFVCLSEKTFCCFITSTSSLWLTLTWYSLEAFVAVLVQEQGLDIFEKCVWCVHDIQEKLKSPPGVSEFCDIQHFLVHIHYNWWTFSLNKNI